MNVLQTREFSVKTFHNIVFALQKCTVFTISYCQVRLRKSYYYSQFTQRWVRYVSNKFLSSKNKHFRMYFRHRTEPNFLTFMLQQRVASACTFSKHFAVYCTVMFIFLPFFTLCLNFYWYFALLTLNCAYVYSVICRRIYILEGIQMPDFRLYVVCH